MCKKLLWLFTDAVEMPHQKKILLKLMVCLILTVDRNLAFIDDVKSALNSAKGYLGNFFLSIHYVKCCGAASFFC
jgi:hypothetical protein